MSLEEALQLILPVVPDATMAELRPVKMDRIHTTGKAPLTRFFRGWMLARIDLNKQWECRYVVAFFHPEAGEPRLYQNYWRGRWEPVDELEALAAMSEGFCG